MLPLTRGLMALFFGWFPISPAEGMCHSRDSSGSLWALSFLHMDSHLQSESCTSAAGFHHCSISQCCHTACMRRADLALCMPGYRMLRTRGKHFHYFVTQKNLFSSKCKDNNCQSKTLHLEHNLISSKSYAFQFKYLALSVEVYLHSLTL